MLSPEPLPGMTARAAWATMAGQLFVGLGIMRVDLIDVRLDPANAQRTALLTLWSAPMHRL